MYFFSNIKPSLFIGRLLEYEINKTTKNINYTIIHIGLFEVDHVYLCY